MSISSESSCFSELGPILKTTIADGIHQSIVSSLSHTEKASVLSDKMLEMLKKYPQGKIENTLKNMIIPLSGQLPFRIDIFAKGIFEVFESYDSFQKKFQQLPEAEKEAILRQLPENSLIKDVVSGKCEKLPKTIAHLTESLIRDYIFIKCQNLLPTSVAHLMENQIRGQIIDPESLPHIAKVTHVMTGSVVALSNGLATAGDGALLQGKMLMSKATEQAITSEHVPHRVKHIIIKGKEKLPVVAEKVQSIWNVVAQKVAHVGREGIIFTMGIVREEVEKDDTVIEKIVGLLTSNIAFFEETLKKLDSTLKELPPSKMLNTVFLSIDQFNQLNIQAREECPEEFVEDELFLQKFKIYYAAKSKQLPTPTMNQAFHLLCDPKDEGKSLRERYNLELGNAFFHIQPSEENQRKAFEAFFSFCNQHQLQDQPPKSLETIKSAFLVHYLTKSSSIAGASQIKTGLFLAEMILLNPRDFLGDQEIQLEVLMKKAGILFAKQSLYPTIVQKFLPPDFNDLISGISQLTGSNLEEAMSTAIANAIVENGITYLTNPQAISTIILQALGADVAQYSQFTVGDGTRNDIHHRLGTLLLSLNTPHHSHALKGISAQKNSKTQEEIGQEVVAEIDEKMDSRLAEYSALIQKIIEKPGHALGTEVAALSQRKDWGLCLLMFTDQLNKTLQDPAKAPDIDLVSVETQLRLERMIKNFYPSAASLINKLRLVIPQTLIESTLKAKQDKLRSQSYSGYIDSIENNLLLKHLTKRFMDGLKFHTPQSVPAEIDEALLSKGIGQALNHHVNEMIQAIWGVEAKAPEAREYRKECLLILNQQPTSEILDFIRRGDLKSAIIKRQELALTDLTAEIDDLILKPMELASIYPFNLKNVEKRLKKSAIKGKQKERIKFVEAKKYLSLHMKMTKLHHSLSLIYQIDGKSISPSIERKMEFLNLRIAEADLKGQPEQDKKKLEELYGSLGHLYQKLLEIDFGFAIDSGVENFEMKLVKSEKTIEDLLSKLTLDKEGLDKQEKNLFQEIGRLSQAKKKLEESVTAFSKRNAYLQENIALLDEEILIQKSIYENAEKQFEMGQRLARKQNEREEYIRRKEKAMNLLSRTANKLFPPEDQQLMIFTKEISLIDEEMAKLRSAIAEEAIRLQRGLYPDALLRLEEKLGTQDLLAIKALSQESLDREQAQKEQLQALNHTLEDIESQFAEVKHRKEVKMSEINQTVKKQSEILAKLNCINYLHLIDKEKPKPALPKAAINKCKKIYKNITTQYEQKFHN